MASTRSTAIRLGRQQQIIRSYEWMLAIVDDRAARRRYRRKLEGARKRVAALRALQMELQRLRGGGTTAMV